MKQFYAFSSVLILLFSCNEKTKQAHEEHAFGNVWVSEDLQAEAGLVLDFRHGELSRFPDTILQRHTLARLDSDTLFLTFRTPPGYVSGRVECKIINDTMMIEAVKSSCTYTNYYSVLNSMLNINKWPVQMNDTILISMNALLACNLQMAVEVDTLYVFGSSKVIVHPGYYSFPDIRYDFDSLNPLIKNEFFNRRAVF